MKNQWMKMLGIVIIGICSFRQIDTLPVYAAPELSEGDRETVDSTWLENFSYTLSTDEEGKSYILLNHYDGNDEDVIVHGNVFLQGSEYNVYVGCSVFNNTRVKSVRFLDGVKADDSLQYLFSWCEDLEYVDLSGLDTSRVECMQGMFSECYNLKELNLTNLNTEKVTDMSDMFKECYSLVKLDLSGFDTSNVVYMDYMFFWDSELESIDLSSFNTKKVTSMSCMFGKDEKLETIDLSNFDLTSCEPCDIFDRYTPKTIYTPVNNHEQIMLNQIYVDADGKEYTALPSGKESEKSIVLNWIGHSDKGDNLISGVMKASSLEADKNYILNGDLELVMDTDAELSGLETVTRDNTPAYDLKLTGSGKLTTSYIKGIERVEIGGKGIIVEAVSGIDNIGTLILNSEGGILETTDGVLRINGLLEADQGEIRVVGKVNDYSLRAIDAGIILLRGGSIEVSNYGEIRSDKFTMESGKLTSKAIYSMGYALAAPEMLISGGTIQIEGTDGVGGVAGCISCGKFHMTGGEINAVDLISRKFADAEDINSSVIIDDGKIDLRRGMTAQGMIRANGGVVNVGGITAEDLYICGGELRIKNGEEICLDDSVLAVAGIFAKQICFSGGDTQVSVPNGRAIMLYDYRQSMEDNPSLDTQISYQNGQKMLSDQQYLMKNETMEGMVMIAGIGKNGYYPIAYYVDDKDNEICEIHISDEEKKTDHNNVDLILHEDGSLTVIEDEKEITDYAGFADYNGSKFFVMWGKIDTGLSNLINDPNHPENWYFLANGQVVDYTGLAVYDDEWFYVEEGRLDIEKSGFVDYNGGRFLVAAGQIVRTQNGLTQDPETGDWYFLSEGQVADLVTDLAFYDDHWFYIIKGKLAEDYTGIVEYNGAEFNVVNGMVR